MCYPEAETHYAKFLTAVDRFSQDLHDLLIFSQPSKSKYILVYNNNYYDRKLSVYLQAGTDNLVKIVINCQLDVTQYKKESVAIYAEDAIIMGKLEALASVKIMRDSMAVCREVVYEDQVLVKLKYGDLNSTK